MSKRLVLLCISILLCYTGFANESLFKQARTLQREGKFNEAIESFKEFLKNKDNRQELETLTPSSLKTEGENKFRQKIGINTEYSL